MPESSLQFTPFDRDALEKKLEGQLIGRRVVCFDSVGSTNEVAKRFARSAASTGLVVIADQQTRGRGRLKRAWFSPRGAGLWFSIILRPSVHTDRAGLISILAATAVSQAVEAQLKIDVDHKWPNDLLIRGRKFSGILLESEYESNVLRYIVLGIGINANQSESDFPPELLTTATSLRLATGTRVDRETLLIKLLQEIEYQYQLFESRKYDKIVDDWKRKCMHFQQSVLLQHGSEKVPGICHDIDNYGRLVLRQESGRLIFVNSGEMSLVAQTT